MTSHLHSHGRTDIRPEVLSVVQTGNGIQHVEYDIQALRMCTHTEKTTFKDKEKRSNSSKKMPMPELHTVPALSRLCSLFLSGIQKDILTDPIKSRDGVYPKRKVLVVSLPTRQRDISLRVNYFCRLILGGTKIIYNKSLPVNFVRMFKICL